MREASANSTSVNVASASSLTVSPEGAGSTRPSASAPTSNPNPVNTMADVTGVPSIRRDIAANASNASASVASVQVNVGQTARLMGNVAIQATVQTKRMLPRTSKIFRSRGSFSLVLIPAKKSETAQRTTPRT